MAILTLQEKQKLLFEWNHKQDCHLIPPNIISLFEHQAAHFQKHIALVFNSITITYADLNNRANQVATYLLQALGENQKEQFIAVIMERSIEVIISFLGILKAGFSFIPIDPKWPIQRIQCICTNASIPIILTQTSLVERYKIIFPDIAVNSLKHFVNNEKIELDTKICISQQKAAYAIYTSGTTQSPKGVVVEHGALLNTICNHIYYLNINRDSIVLNFSSPTFDVFVAELAMTLCTGAKLCITPKEGLLGQKLFDFMERHQITTAMLPASVLERLPQKPLQNLLVLVSGGEVCQQVTIDYWAENRVFLNAYGLTETTICSTMHSNINSKAEQSNIGAPLPNVQIYILDEAQKLLPIGVSGEIYIAGKSLARGYLNEPDLTKQVFINNPFEPNKKMCRTGDYGRWRSDGNLEYLGRQDSQIKLRGYRINLQEINTTLLSNPIVKNSVTIVQTQIEQILIAYLVLKKYTKSFNSQSLKQFLKQRLPEYMIPNLFIVVQNIPLTDHGKIDYLKLNQLFDLYQKKMLDEQTDNTVDTQSSSIKRSIIDTLKGLLCCNVVSEEINFFDLGMHSFLLIRAIEILNKKLSVQMNVMDFFNYSTVNKLTAYLEEKLK
jgi:amino acid adenylation domain-containing protein